MPGLGPHLIDTADLGRDQIDLVMQRAAEMAEVLRRPVKKLATLRGRTVCTAFFEGSTRTRHSFELAARRLSADVISFSPAGSSTGKDEGLEDTVRTIQAMGVDIFVVRHAAPGAAHKVAASTRASVINAGDGAHAHPTQALLDLRTILDKKRRIDGLTVAIVGDIAHSRVVRSNLYTLRTCGARVRLIGPPSLMPPAVDRLGVEVHHDLVRGLAGADVVMALRLQKERMEAALLPSMGEYIRRFRIDAAAMRHAAPDAIVMHPGPMNRGIEITAEVADGPQSVIEAQVTNGIAVRMAVMSLLTGPERAGGEA